MSDGEAPRTEAGRQFYDDLRDAFPDKGWNEDVASTILAIEREAASAAPPECPHPLDRQSWTTGEDGPHCGRCGLRWFFPNAAPPEPPRPDPKAYEQGLADGRLIEQAARRAAAPAVGVDVSALPLDVEREFIQRIADIDDSVIYASAAGRVLHTLREDARRLARLSESGSPPPCKCVGWTWKGERHDADCPAAPTPPGEERP